MLLYMANRFCRCDYRKDLEEERLSWMMEWAQCNHKRHRKWKRRAVGEIRMMQCEIQAAFVGSGDGGRGPGPRNVGSP